MKENKNTVNVPVCEKAFLTIEEASAYTNIGKARLRDLSDRTGSIITLYVGTKRLLKRDSLIEYLSTLNAV